MTIQLPHEPKSETYEDLLAACLTGLGFFVETNLHLVAAKTEVLELDVVATPVDDPLKNSVLFDAKSGRSGISDLFKLFGWRTYLNIPKACVVRPEPPDSVRHKAMKKIEKETAVAVSVVNLDDFDPDCFPSDSIEIPNETRDALIVNAWFGRIGKRLCLQAFNSFTKYSGFQIAKTARKYRLAIEQSFFEPQPIQRARVIYDTYQETPGITGKIIDKFAEDECGDSKKIWNQVRDGSERLAVQFSLMMEHTARLRIVKNAMIHLVQKEAECKTKKDALNWIFREWVMPQSFCDGLKILGKHEHRGRIPFLWQLFIEVFGGFYCLKDDCDLEAISECTEIPADEIPSCLELYGTFFPNKWFMEPKGELRMMKNVPAVYHGTGAFLRDSLFGSKNYTKHVPNMGWLLEVWHNALYTILEPELKVDDDKD